MSDQLFIFDGQSEELLSIISNDSDGTTNYIEAKYKEKINQDFFFEADIPDYRDGAQYIVEGNIVGFFDHDDDFQAFYISSVEYLHDDTDMKYRYLEAEHVFYELMYNVVEDLRVRDSDAQEAVTKAIDGSRVLVGQVDELGLGVVSFYYSNSLQNLLDTVEEFGGELKFRLELDGNKLGDRYVDLLTRRGADTGKRFEYGKDLTEITCTVNREDLRTALYGRGNGQEIEDSDGYTRKLTFADVEWSTDNGDPVDKPLGQEWVGDPDALANHGFEDGTRHIMGVMDLDVDNAEELLQRTWDELQSINEPKVTYELSAIDLESFSGYDHEAVRLGDTVAIVDHELGITLEARVVEIERYLNEPERTEVVLGNFVEFYTDEDERVERLTELVSDRKDIWDSASEPTEIDDSDVVDEVPAVPTNFIAQSYFSSVGLSWDFDPSIKVAGYEIYGSQTPGFNVDSSNLLYRGKSAAFIHNADVNQTWYFRARAYNPHGTKSDLTEEISAITQRVNADTEVEPQTITAQLIANEAIIQSVHIGNSVINDAHIDSLTADILDVQQLSSITADLGTVNAGEVYGVYIEGGELYSPTDGGDTFTRIKGSILTNESVQDYGTGITEIASGQISQSVKEDSSQWLVMNANDGLLSVNGNRIAGRNTPIEYQDSNFNVRAEMKGNGLTTYGENYNMHSPDVSSSWVRGYRITDRNGNQMFGLGSYGSGRYRSNINYHFIGGSHTDNRFMRFYELNESPLRIEADTHFEANDSITSIGGITFTNSSTNGSFKVDLTENEVSGISVRATSNPSTGDPIFTVESAGSSTRFIVNHNSDVEIPNDGLYAYGEINARGGFHTGDGNHIRTSGYSRIQSNVFQHNGVGTYTYLQSGSGAEIRVTEKEATSNYRPIRASSFPTSSLAENKTDIQETELDALSIIQNIKLYDYRLKDDKENGVDKLRTGFVIGEDYDVPDEVLDETGEGVEQYLMNSLSLQGVKQIIDKLDNIEQRLEALENK